MKQGKAIVPSRKYITIQDYFKINAERHLERAIGYIAAGYPDHYADGSLAKAKRNFKKYDMFWLDPFVEDLIKPIIDKIAERMTDIIMNGDK